MHQRPRVRSILMYFHSKQPTGIKHFFFFHQWEINNFSQWSNTVPLLNIACLIPLTLHLPSHALNLWNTLLFFSSWLATFITPPPHWHTVEIAKMSNHVIHYQGDLPPTPAGPILFKLLLFLPASELLLANSRSERILSYQLLSSRHSSVSEEKGGKRCFLPSDPADKYLMPWSCSSSSGILRLSGM